MSPEAGFPGYDDCRLCPRQCGADRTAGERGFCGAGDIPVVSSAFPHHGEESVLRGTRGSGTIFFCGCNLKCVFCQNHDISGSTAGGTPVSPEELAVLMLSLQRHGCHNVNFVTPTHFAPSIARAVEIARREGLVVPVVYNCGGYESPEVIRALEGVVDIYMPDVKFLDPERSARFLRAPDYPDAVREAVALMDTQVGRLQVRNGTAVRGLLVRHLVMPGGYEDSRRIMDFLASACTPGTYVNVMDQYRPCHRAADFPDIAGYPDPAEIAALKEYARDKGLTVID